MPKQRSNSRISRQDRARIKALSREVDRAKGTVAKEAKARLRIALKQANAAAKEAEKYNKKQQALLVKEFRHQWSILRRKGLVNKDARSVAFSSRNRKVVEEYGHVLSGKEKTFRVKSKKQRDALKAQGVTIRNGVAVVSKDYNIRNGKVYSAQKGGRRIFSIDAGQLSRDDVAQAVRNAFKKIKPKYGLAFRFQGYNSFQIYPDAELMIQDLLEGYARAFEKFSPSIEFFDPGKEFEEYQVDRIRESFIRQTSKNDSKKERAKARRAAKKFLAGMVKAS